MDVLVRHAIEGYQGSTGFMPAKGARLDLSDEEVADAVDYMVSESS
jgi:cytochrome c5